MPECPVCQQPNRPDARFCRHCGAEINPPGEPAPASPPVDNTPVLESAMPLPPLPETPPDSPAANPRGTAPLPPLPEDVPEDAPPPEGTASPTEAGEAQPPGASERIEEAAPLQGSSPSAGDLIGERYRIRASHPSESETPIYEAEDLRLCPGCAHLQSEIGDTYCENCGALLEPRPTVQIYPAASTPAAAENAQTERITEGGQEYWVVAQAATRPSAAPPILQLSVGVQSDAGEVREIDEDSVLVLQAQALGESGGPLSLGFFAVADGIGGHAAGEVASGIAIRTLAEAILGGIFVPAGAGHPPDAAARQEIFRQAVLAANQAILSARAETGQDMGSTLTAALVFGEQATILNVGDSRTYRMRMGQLQKITEDHSIVAKLLAQGMIAPDEVYTHEQKSVIYRSLGGEVDLELDDARYEITLEPGDRLLLCCDGLWEMVRDPYLEDTLLEYLDPQAAADRLVEMANLAGGEDNISAVVVNVQSLKRFR